MKYNIVIDTGNTVLDGMDTTNLWNFVAYFYPGFSSSDEIGYSDILQRIADGEYEEGDEEDTAWGTLQRDFEGDVQAAKIALLVSNEDIYDRTISNFLSQIVKIEKI